MISPHCLVLPHIMTLRLLVTILAGVTLSACTSNSIRVNAQFPEETKTKFQEDSKVSVQGVLEYIPSTKSLESWLGHQYKVGDTPIKPTREIPTDTLQSLVGETVIIEGIWNPGKKWEPSEEEELSQHPIFWDNETVMRGAGLEALTIQTATLQSNH